jgi:mRNA interferase MazF
MGMVNRFDVYLVNLDPTVGVEIKKTRPCLIVSPDEMNHHTSAAIVAPMTTKFRDYPTRVSLSFQNKEGYVALDQIRTVDKSRLMNLLGQIDKITQRRVLAVLQEMFSL